MEPTFSPPEGVRHFYTKVVGITHRNRDHSSRQKVIKEMLGCEAINLENESSNPHDPNAIKVLTTEGEQIGYLSAELARDVVKRREQGFRFCAITDDIYEWDVADEFAERARIRYGVTLLIFEVASGVSDETLRQYVLDAFGKKGPYLMSFYLKQLGVDPQIQLPPLTLPQVENPSLSPALERAKSSNESSEYLLRVILIGAGILILILVIVTALSLQK